MSAPIRPLPIEAAPQRTESGPTKSSQPDDAPGFGTVLRVHLEDKKEEPKHEPAKTPKKPEQADLAPWTILGVALLPPTVPPVNQPAPSSAGSTSPAPVSTNSASEKSPTAKIPADSAPSEGITDILALLKQLTPAPEVQQKITPASENKLEEIAAKPAESGQKPHGIRDAKQVTMLLTQEKKDTPSSPEQQGRFDTPQMEAASVEQAPLVVRPPTKTVEHPVEFPTEKVSLLHDTFSPAFRTELPSPASEPQRVNDLRAAAVVDSIREHVLVVRVSQQQELNVVLRPDAHTELFLQIRHIDGQVHLKASCARGDFTWLDSQWSTVQNTLANQGVRVEPLQSAFRAQDSTSSLLMQDRSGSQQREQKATAPNSFFEQEDPKPRNKTSSRPITSGPRGRGWQSWA